MNIILLLYIQLYTVKLHLFSSKFRWNQKQGFQKNYLQTLSDSPKTYTYSDLT